MALIIQVQHIFALNTYSFVAQYQTKPLLYNSGMYV